MDNPLNAVSNFIGEKKAMVGIPSVSAMELYSASMGCDLTWIDPSGLDLQNHAGLGDYFRTGRKRRQLCLRRPPTSSQIVTWRPAAGLMDGGRLTSGWSDRIRLRAASGSFWQA